MAKKPIEYKVGDVVFVLKPIPFGLFTLRMEDLINDMPKPPKREVVYMGGHIELEDDDEDADYLSKINMWSAQSLASQLRLCLLLGIEKVTDAKGNTLEPSEDEIEMLQVVHQGLSKTELMVYWRASLMKEQQQDFINTVTGQNSVTEEGLADAENKTRPDGDDTGGNEG